MTIRVSSGLASSQVSRWLAGCGGSWSISLAASQAAEFRQVPNGQLLLVTITCDHHSSPSKQFNSFTLIQPPPLIRQPPSKLIAHTATMQRPTYASVPPAQSPPLHHPVPQHVSTVPQLRSPPPPSSQNSYGYGQSQDPQAAAGGAGYNNMHPAFGGFMEDPTTKMAMGFAGQGISVGQQYMEQNV